MCSFLSSRGGKASVKMQKEREGKAYLDFISFRLATGKSRARLYVLEERRRGVLEMFKTENEKKKNNRRA